MSRSRRGPLLVTCSLLLLLALAAPAVAHAVATAVPGVASPAAGAAAAPGDVLWARTFGPTPQMDSWDCAAAGPDGSLYVAGRHGTASGFTGAMVARYTPKGVRAWEFIYRADDSDRIESIAVDRAGNVYAVGTAWDDVMGWDILVLKLSATGAKRWELRLGGVGAVEDEGQAVALDRAGNVYVAGLQTNPRTGLDAVVAKLTPSGEQRYRAFYRTAGPDQALHAVVDATGQAYVAGTALVGGQPDAFLMKLSAVGSRLWVRTIDGSAHQGDYPQSLILAGGHLYLAATLQSTVSREVAVAKFSLAGARRWLRTYAGPDDGDDWGVSMAVDAAGAAYVVGETITAGNLHKGLLVKWDAGGRRRWARLFCNPADNADGALFDVAVGPGSSIYCVGRLVDPVSRWDVLAVAYTPTGTRRWRQVWNSEGDGEETAGQVVVARTASGTAVVYACGTIYPSPEQGIDGLVLRLKP